MLTGIAVDRPLVGKDLHAVDQRDDAVGLVGDEPGQRAVLVAQPALQQLRGAADAGQRVLDLMRQHRRQAGDRARGAAMRHLAVDLVGHRAFLEHHDDRAGKLRHRRDIEVDDLLDADARRGNVDAILVDRRLPLAHLIDQRQQRAAERHETRQAVLRQDRARSSGRSPRHRHWRKLMRPSGADHDHRPADGVEHDLRGIERRQALSGCGCSSSCGLPEQLRARAVGERLAQRGDDGGRLGRRQDRLARLGGG